MGFRSFLILNAAESLAPPPDQPIDVALTLAMADLKAQFINPDQGSVRYGAMRGSEPFERYRRLSGGLKGFDLHSLGGRTQKLAFWVNIYNNAVVHGVIELELRRSVREVRRFFERVGYEIGGCRFSLHEMEHGILRENRRPPYRLFKPFRRGDSRLDFGVFPMDPRIHFALVCGSRSCPPIAFYEADQIDFQLDLAAAGFINSPRVKIEPEEMAVSLSMIFKWYRADFGKGRDGVMDTLLRFLDEGEKKEFLRRNRDKILVRYLPYDWSLNRET